MQESSEQLRENFYAQTNVEVNNEACCWKRYACWLEQQSMEKINLEMREENKKLRNICDKVMDLFEDE
jgi:hypothetical protein